MAVTTYDGPLELVELPEPEITSEGQALLEVIACGVCYSDVKTSEGKMPFSADLALPHVPGHEICARVITTDPPGAIEAGATVVVHHYVPCGLCPACRAGEENLCSNLRAWIGFTAQGGFAERLVVPLDRLFEVPAGIDPKAAAPLTCAVGTAYRSVVTRGKVEPGSRVVVIGLGGVGLHSLQVARACGAITLGVDRSVTALEAARGLEIAASSDQQLSQSSLGDLIGGSADLVIDNVATEETLTLGASLLRAGGRMVVVGYSPTTSLKIPTPRLVLDEIELIGSRYVRRDELARAIELVAMGGVEPVVGKVRPLEEANQAFDDLRTGAGIGRTVLQVDEVP